MRKQFGGKITKELAQRYAQSRHWSGNKFLNLEETNMDISFQHLPKLLYNQFCKSEGRAPKQNLPIAPFNGAAFLATSEKTKFIWYGHSVVLMRINNKTVLIDPMFGSDASPIAPFATRRFSDNTLDIIDALPPIDLLLLTHDHYDHLDYDSMQRLIPKVNQYFVALGSARHLVKWGVAETKIQEFDWWDTQAFFDVAITFTPSRHFSGRGLSDRSKSLWGGWVFKTRTENIYFSGDGGYGSHFKTIGERLGPFDFGFMECGQYNELWRQIHMYPEESVTAGIDAQANILMPVHWGAFTLSHHQWKEPVTGFVQAAKDKNKPVLTPEIGKMVILGETPTADWWRDLM
jgi:L-ascorbate metabolism protein UlaG (beta-lactamase superfamily)